MPAGRMQAVVIQDPEIRQGQEFVRVALFDENYLPLNLVGGEQGIQGPPGIPGQPGAQGPKGDKGDKGDTGSPGAKGDTGAQGVQGPQGLTGAGEPGPQGPRGDIGVPGPQGLKGDKGDTGNAGPAGIQGPQGPKGDTGAQGPQGNQGLPAPVVPVVTVLPPNPVDEDQVYFKVNEHTRWHLVYNAEAVAPYKWIFLSGQPLWDETPLEELYAGAPANMWVNVSGQDPLITPPLPGEYMCDHGASLAAPPGHVHLGLAVGAVEPSVAAGSLNAKPAWQGSSGSWTPISHIRRLTVPTAGEAVYHRYRMTVAGNLYRSAAYLSMVPYRVKAA